MLCWFSIFKNWNTLYYGHYSKTEQKHALSVVIIRADTAHRELNQSTDVIGHQAIRTKRRRGGSDRDMAGRTVVHQITLLGTSAELQVPTLKRLYLQVSTLATGNV